MFSASLGVFLALTVSWYLFALLSAIPISKGWLVNKPRGERGAIKMERWIYFFTYVEPGQIKIVIRGERFIRCIMDYAGYKFRRHDSGMGPQKPEHWEVVPSATPHTDDDALAEFSLSPLGFWAWWIYKSTGAVFVGIPPFQSLWTYTIPRLVQEMDREGNPILVDGKPILETKSDRSDHLRAREFIWNWIVPSADTKDKVPVSVTGALRMECRNPVLAAFASDSWPQALTNAIIAKVTAFLRTIDYERVVAHTDETEIVNMLGKINEDLDGQGIGTLTRYGLQVVKVQVFDYHPLLEGDAKDALMAPFAATKKAEATITAARANAEATVINATANRRATVMDGEGRAAAVARLITVLAQRGKRGDIGRLIQALEAQVNTAKAGGATFFFGQGGQNSGLDPAIIAELGKLNVSMTELRDGLKQQVGTP